MVRNRLCYAHIGIADEAFAGAGEPGVTAAAGDSAAPPSAPTPRWGAPGIRGELLKLGIDISQATVSKHMIGRRGPPSQTWRTFLENPAREMIALDFFAVPTATFRVLVVLVVLSHDRLGCVDCVIVLGERHLKRAPHEYVHYYNLARTRLAQEEDAPCCRAVHLGERGGVYELDHLNGLHHEYVRMAA